MNHSLAASKVKAQSDHFHPTREPQEQSESFQILVVKAVHHNVLPCVVAKRVRCRHRGRYIFSRPDATHSAILRSRLLNLTSLLISAVCTGRRRALSTHRHAHILLWIGSVSGRSVPAFTKCTCRGNSGTSVSLQITHKVD